VPLEQEAPEPANQPEIETVSPELQLLREFVTNVKNVGSESISQNTLFGALEQNPGFRQELE
jgi:hypothetical protein